MNRICVYIYILSGCVDRTKEASVGNGQTRLALGMPSRSSASILDQCSPLSRRPMTEKNQERSLSYVFPIVVGSRLG